MVCPVLAGISTRTSHRRQNGAPTTIWKQKQRYRLHVDTVCRNNSIQIGWTAHQLGKEQQSCRLIRKPVSVRVNCSPMESCISSDANGIIETATLAHSGSIECFVWFSEKWSISIWFLCVDLPATTFSAPRVLWPFQRKTILFKIASIRIRLVHVWHELFALHFLVSAPLKWRKLSTGFLCRDCDRYHVISSYGIIEIILSKWTKWIRSE